MRKIHVAVIAGLFAIAALAGTFAATRTTTLGAAARTSSAAAVATRTRQLDAYAASLDRALAAKPPALPRLGAGTATHARVQAVAPRVVYRRPAPIVVVSHTRHGDDVAQRGDGGVGDD